MAITAALPRSAVHPWPMDTIPDPEVPERPTRRHFGAAYKVAILDELDQATEPGSKGAILRREGLYSSHVTEWRRLRALGGFEALGRPRGPNETGYRGLREGGHRCRSSPIPTQLPRRNHYHEGLDFLFVATQGGRPMAAEPVRMLSSTSERSSTG